MSGSEDEIQIDVSLPDWVKALRPLAGVVNALVTFGRNPVRFVFTTITSYILLAVFGVLNVVTGSVLYAFDLVLAALQFVQNFLVSGFGAVGVDILAVLVDLQVAVAGVVAGAGPAGPVVAVGLAAGGTYAVYRAGIVVLALINPT